MVSGFAMPLFQRSISRALGGERLLRSLDRFIRGHNSLRENGRLQPRSSRRAPRSSARSPARSPNRPRMTAASPTVSESSSFNSSARRSTLFSSDCDSAWRCFSSSSWASPPSPELFSLANAAPAPAREARAATALISRAYCNSLSFPLQLPFTNPHQGRFFYENYFGKLFTYVRSQDYNLSF